MFELVRQVESLCMRLLCASLVTTIPKLPSATMALTRKWLGKDYRYLPHTRSLASDHQYRTICLNATKGYVSQVRDD